MKRKILKSMIFLFMTIFGIFASSNIVHAEEYVGDFVEGGYIESKVYINKRQSNGYTRWERAGIIIQRSTGQVVYCLQPMVLIQDGAIYNVTTEDYAGAQNLTSEQYNRIRLLAYYGYGYGNHTSTDWISITQTLIWRTTRPDLDIYYSWGSKATNRDDSIFANEIAELENLVSSHYSRPSFNTNTIDMFIGETRTISDGNGVLSLYSIKSKSNVDASISGNNLNITATGIGNAEITLEKNEGRFGSDPIIFYAVDSQNIIKPGDPKPVSAKLNINVTGGKIKVIKHDSENNSCSAQGSATLVGAKYGVYNSNGTQVSTLTIGSDCSAITDYLPHGNYTVKEISSSTGYLLDNTTYSVNINSSTTFDVVVKENVIKSRVQVNKYDQDNNNQTARGQATLSGAKYGVYDSRNNLVETITTDENGNATSSLLPYGSYKVKELEPSTGYKIDTGVYNVTVSEHNQTIHIKSYEKVYENWISILKQYDYVDGQTTFLNAEANINFEIYYPDGRLYDTIKTDRNGYATITIPYGVWKFHQVNSNTGFEKIYDFYITVSKTSEEEQYYNILNNKIASYLQVFKRDSETGKTIALANTTFKIFNRDTNQYVSQYVGGNVYSEFKTDSEGKFVTYLKLDAGNYRLVETKAPKSYLKNTTGMDFTIGDDTYYNYTTYGAFVTVYFDNTPIKGQIEIYKSGEAFNVANDSYNYGVEIPLSNIKYNIYAKEDIKTSDGNYIYYRKDTLVQTVTTNDSGYAISKKLPLGKYYVVEVETNENYILDTTEHNVELKEIDDRTPIVYESIMAMNRTKKGNLEFTKTDLVTGKPIKDTTISIYTEDDEKIFEGKTDDKGKITVKSLPVGVKMYIIETDCEGYVLSDEKVYFEITDNGEVKKAEMKNKPITGSLEFTKLNFVNDEPVENTLISIYSEDGTLEFSGRTDSEGKIVFDNIRYGKHYIVEEDAPKQFVLNPEKIWFEIREDGQIIKAGMKNKIKVSTAKIHKVDENNNPIEGVEIGIYDLEGNLLFSALTDANGDIETTMAYGSYYWQEIAGVDGFIMSDEKVYFDVTEDGEIIQKTLINEAETIEVPDTEANFDTILIPIGFILLGVTLILFKRKKDK